MGLGIPLYGGVGVGGRPRRPVRRADRQLALPWRAIGAASAVVFTVGAILAALPEHPIGFHHMTFRVAIDTAAGLAALIAAWVVGSRYRRLRSRASWLLMAGLACYAVTLLLNFSLPAALGLQASESAGVPLLGRLVAGMLLVASAVADGSPMRRAPSERSTLLFVLGMSVACAGAGALAGTRFPAAVIGDVGDGSTTVIAGASPIFIGLTAVTIALYLVCGAILWARALPVHDRTMAWLGIGAGLVGFGRPEAMITASASVSWVSGADFLRLAATGAFLTASAVEFRCFELRLKEAAAAAERHRLARELHDGLGQDLAFVVNQARTLARNGPDAEALGDIATAAERAMSDTRKAIHVRNRPRSRGLSAVVVPRAYEVCSRSGLDLSFAMLGGEVETSPDVEHAVVGIVSEALSNAARHSGAHTVAMQIVSTGDAISVRVSDDGRGFDPDAVPRRRVGGLGLVSMAERAHAIGGELLVDSDPDSGGTTVEVRFS